MFRALKHVVVQGIGVIGPGMPNWPAARYALTHPQDWSPEPVAVQTPFLPPAEARRAGSQARLALAVAAEAVAMAKANPADLATVFASSGGDGANCDALCALLATMDRPVSPLRFLNSVHNAPASYWHIAHGSSAPSTSLAAHDASFGAGLAEAIAQCLCTNRAVLLVTADVPYPAALHAVRPLAAPFGSALVLAPDIQQAGKRIALGGYANDAQATTCQLDGRLEAIRAGVPAARGLPLLKALLSDEDCVVVLQTSPRSRVRIAIR